MNFKNKLLIYVVEDNKIFNRLICEFLKKQDFKRVESFHTGKECIKKVLEGGTPDIVIQDYFLDDMNGIEVLQAVKKNYKKAEFIFLTANQNMEVAVNSIKYGAFDYIIKDKDVALKKVVINIERVTKLRELNRGKTVIRQLMLTSILVLILIVVVAMLHVLFDAFGLRQY